MGLRGPADVAFCLLGGRSIMGDLTSIQDSQEAVVEDTTRLGVAADTWAAVGVTKYEATLRAIYSDSGIRTAFESAAVQALMYGMEGNTVGNEFTGVDAVRAQITRNTTRDAFHQLEATFKANAGMDQGVIMADLEARDDQSSAETVVDNAASSSAGAVGYLGLSALTLGGYTNIIVKIRDSTDDNTYADLITFTAVTSAPASERKTASGTVNRYAKATWAWTGAGSGETATFAVGMKRG